VIDFHTAEEPSSCLWDLDRENNCFVARLEAKGRRPYLDEKENIDARRALSCG
jgi:hypothetical protein